MIAKLEAGVVFQVLDLSFYDWRWIREWEILEIKLGRKEMLFEVKKLERDGAKITVVVSPIKEVVS